MRLFQAFLRRYARGEARVLAPHVIGPRLLDLGAGEGWVGEAVHMLTPAWTCAVDVGPFRLAKGPYAIYDGTRLPFAEDTFDTTLISFVLHHCERPEAVFAEAVRVTRARLLVIESVYRSRVEHFWLDLLDRQLNRHRHDGRMNVPLAFRRPEEWQALFESHSLRVVATEWLGSWVERLVHHPLLFAMDKGPATRRAVRSAFPTTGRRYRSDTRLGTAPDLHPHDPCHPVCWASLQDTLADDALQPTPQTAIGSPEGSGALGPRSSPPGTVWSARIPVWRADI